MSDHPPRNAERESEHATAQEPIAPPIALSNAPPLLLLDHVHARDDFGPKGTSRGILAGLHLALGPGVHAILGAPEDGTVALIEAVVGARAVLRGRVLVGGRDPAVSPAARARIGALGAAVDLPDARSVDASVRMAMRARGDGGGSPEAILAPFGLSAILARAPRSLSYVETRAVELALALTTPAPLLVALYEPFVDVAVQSLAIVRARVRELADAGACVLVVTSSPADATSFTDHVRLLQRGLIAAVNQSGSAGLIPGAPVELAVWVRDPDGAEAGVRELAASVSGRPEVRAVAWEEHRGAGPGGSSLRVQGDDLDACAWVILEAAIETGAIIDAIAPVTPGLAEVRAATNALLARRYAQPLVSRSARPKPTAEEPAAALEPAAPEPAPAASGDPGDR